MNPCKITCQKCGVKLVGDQRMKRIYTTLIILSALIGFITPMTTEWNIWLTIAVVLGISLIIALPLSVLAYNTSYFLIESSKVETDDTDNPCNPPKDP